MSTLWSKSSWTLVTRSARPPRRLTTRPPNPNCCCPALLNFDSQRRFTVTTHRRQAPLDSTLEDMAPKAPKFDIKTPKGTKDCTPPQFALST
ncbi:hypothetical protein B0H67DRAFT_565450 [Lasiosphaeris hirsuta]|uniref:Uncharacterized protein n=1 Tax=Lasiosphaeris hirsuta TaxID=260670 RepID=A0AA40BCC7_9PEZI|nr:hypothetical protein B0H67DRAFT_565450 [Lasiosphaeris hirsuta]